MLNNVVNANFNELIEFFCFLNVIFSYFFLIIQLFFHIFYDWFRLELSLFKRV